MEPFTSIAPGRLCLFGEHQDYLGLPVIAMAIPLTCRIQAEPSGDRLLTVVVPQLDRTTVYNLDGLPPRQNAATIDPDFALAAIHKAIEEGWALQGAHCVSETDIVMRAGCSSSSAFCVAWVNVLARLAGESLLPVELAQRAFSAEVSTFGASGGTMDHMTSSIGGMLRIGPGKWEYEVLPDLTPDALGVWVLAYSGEPKDTQKHLKRCKTARLQLLEKLGDWDRTISDLDPTETALLQATLTNRNTEAEAAHLWKDATAGNIGPQLGSIMNLHHKALRDGLDLSTDSFEAMREAASQAGAWGFKVVGSGGGGCAVAWVDRNCADDVREAMERAGAPLVWIFERSTEGAKIA